MRFVAAAVLFLASFAPPSRPAIAGTNANACLSLHVGPKSRIPGACQRGPAYISYMISAGFLYPPASYFTYLVVADYDVVCGVAGGRVGIAMDAGVTVWSWRSCFVNETRTVDPAWPSSGSGIEWSWDAASTDPILGCHKDYRPAVVGYFYMGAYSPGRMRVTRHPDGPASVVSCYAVPDSICGPGDVKSPCTGVSHFGEAAFNAAGTGGYLPCGFITLREDPDRRVDSCTAPVRRLTWGVVKGMYR